MSAEVKAALVAAVDAYDAARCKTHGQDVAKHGMSDTNKRTIAPMIGAAIAAFHRKRAADLRAAGHEFYPQAACHDDLAAAVTAAAQEGGE